MRAKGQKQGRFVALSGLRKVPGPSGSRFPVMIIDATGLPVFPLCEWYRRKKEYDSGRTPDTYLDMLLPYFGFLLQKEYDWNAAPDRVRAALVEFLRMDVGCQVGPAPDDGYVVETTGASPLSKSSLGVLLAALTSLYDVLIDAGYYPFSNPMRSERLTALKREHVNQVKNAGAPDHSGIRSESCQETQQAYATTFFRQKRGKVWEPEVVMEPDAAQERMNTVIDYMIEHAPFQRDQVILLLLRQTGARLSEIIEMTVGGYRKAGHPGRAFVKNKGSRGRDFYYHWQHLFEPAQRQFKKQKRIEFSPHDIRHLRVSRGIATIKQHAQGNKGLEAELLDGFWRLMGWSSSKTMETYTHTLNKRKALLDIVLAEDENQLICPDVSGELLPSLTDDRASAEKIPVHAPTIPLQELVQEDDEFSWYEE